MLEISAFGSFKRLRIPLMTLWCRLLVPVVVHPRQIGVLEIAKPTMTRTYYIRPLGRTTGQWDVAKAEPPGMYPKALVTLFYLGSVYNKRVGMSMLVCLLAVA